MMTEKIRIGSKIKKKLVELEDKLFDMVRIKRIKEKEEKFGKEEIFV